MATTMSQAQTLPGPLVQMISGLVNRNLFAGSPDHFTKNVNRFFEGCSVDSVPSSPSASSITAFNFVLSGGHTHGHAVSSPTHAGASGDRISFSGLALRTESAVTATHSAQFLTHGQRRDLISKCKTIRTELNNRKININIHNFPTFPMPHSPSTHSTDSKAPHPAVSGSSQPAFVPANSAEAAAYQQWLSLDERTRALINEYRSLKKLVRFSSAQKIQAVWKGYKTRQPLSARALPFGVTVSTASNGSLQVHASYQSMASNSLSTALNASASSVTLSPSGPNTSASRVAMVFAHLTQQRKNAGRNVPPESMTHEQLVAEKKCIKVSLSKIEAMLARKTGRIPTKNDKEPYRPIYQLYNQVKNLLAKKGGASATSASAAVTATATAAPSPPVTPSAATPPGGPSTSGPTLTPATSPTIVTTVPPSASINGGAALANGTPSAAASSVVVGTAKSTVKNGSASSTAAANSPAVASSSASSVIGTATVTAAASGLAGGSASSATPETSAQMMRRMKQEKRALQIKLNEFEKQFRSLKGRKIKYQTDITARKRPAQPPPEPLPAFRKSTFPAPAFSASSAAAAFASAASAFGGSGRGASRMETAREKQQRLFEESRLRHEKRTAAATANPNVNAASGNADSQFRWAEFEAAAAAIAAGPSAMLQPPFTLPAFFREETKDRPFTSTERTAAIQMLLENKRNASRCLCLPSPTVSLKGVPLTKSELSKHFRRMAVLVHPDKSLPQHREQATEAFKVLHDAHQQLQSALQRFI